MSNSTRTTNRRPASTRGNRVMAMAVTGSLSAASLVLAAGAASADTTPNSQSEGRFLDGSSGGVNLDALANLAPAQAHNDGGAAVVDRQGIDATALQSVRVPLGTVNLLGPNNILQLGAVNQVAIANANGSSLGASGAVGNDGAILVGGSTAYPANATLDLGSVLPTTGVLDDLDLSLGALSARATEAAQTASGASGNQASSYQIADAVLTLDSTVLSGLLAPLLGQQGAINGIPATLNTLGLGVVTTSPLPNLNNLVAGVGPVTSANGALTVNLATGVITVDLAQLINLNDLPPNTDLLPLIQTALNTQLVPTVQTALNQLSASVTAALNGVTATGTDPLLGTPVPVPAGVLATVVDPVLALLTPNLSPAAVATGLFDNVISDSLAGVLRLTANVQDVAPNTPMAPGSPIYGTFTETALRVSLLGTTAVVNLASASVGPNFGPQAAAVAPVATGINPDHGPVTGGTVVTITGTGFVPGSTVSVDGGPPITPDAINGNGTAIVYTAPPHAAGPVGVTVTTPAGTTAPLTYTYIPAADGTIGTPVITDPENGDVTDDTTPPISGTGTPGATVTVHEGTTVICTAVVRANGTWTCTPSVALGLGSHTITARQTLGGRTSDNSAPVTFRIADGNGNGNNGEAVGGGLPGTGAGFDPLPFGVAGLALLLTGLAMTATQRRSMQD
ncbi:MAG TPA: choice-of-anchor G family protein [Sporichthya sp.]|nr:choice-of-anchor G family protein [Sporichthya sp.]